MNVPQAVEAIVRPHSSLQILVPGSIWCWMIGRRVLASRLGMSSTPVWRSTPQKTHCAGTGRPWGQCGDPPHRKSTALVPDVLAGVPVSCTLWLFHQLPQFAQGRLVAAVGWAGELNRHLWESCCSFKHKHCPRSLLMKPWNMYIFDTLCLVPFHTCRHRLCIPSGAMQPIHLWQKTQPDDLHKHRTHLAKPF